MEIIVIRHGDAMSPDQASAIGLSDDERPLTDQGRARTRAAAAGLRQTLGDDRIGHVLVSPLLRARQTADILGAYLDDPVIDEHEALKSDADVEAVDAALREHGGSERLLLVGHAPALGNWLSWSLTRKHDRYMALTKNGSARIEFPGVADGGTGTLHWLLTGTQLRALAPVN